MPASVAIAGAASIGSAASRRDGGQGRMAGFDRRRNRPWIAPFLQRFPPSPLLAALVRPGTALAGGAVAVSRPADARPWPGGADVPLGRLAPRVAARNLELCFPEKSPAERERLLKENFASSGIAFFEMAELVVAEGAPGPSCPYRRPGASARGQAQGEGDPHGPAFHHSGDRRGAARPGAHHRRHVP